MMCIFVLTIRIKDTRRKIQYIKFRVNAGNQRLVGDTTVDIQTGKNAGLHTALVLTGEAGNDKKYDVTPDLVCKDLWEAVEMILKYKE